MSRVPPLSLMSRCLIFFVPQVFSFHLPTGNLNGISSLSLPFLTFMSLPTWMWTISESVSLFSFFCQWPSGLAFPQYYVPFHVFLVLPSLHRVVFTLPSPLSPMILISMCFVNHLKYMMYYSLYTIKCIVC